MTIPVSKSICGNCGLLGKERCLGGGQTRPPEHLSCFHIRDNYEDRGYELERPPRTNWQPILAEIDAIMEKERAADREFVLRLKREGEEGASFIGCYWHQFWDSGKQVWRVPSLAWVKGDV